MIRSTLLPGLLSATLLLAGCYTRETRIQLDADGSGTLEIVTTARQALLDYAHRQAGLPPEENWFSESVLQRAAQGYGQNVTYLDHHIESIDDGKRFTVRYHFEDISKLNLPLDTQAPFFLTPPDRLRDQRPTYRFDLQDGWLTIHPPPKEPPERSGPQVRVESAKAKAQRQERFEKDRTLLMRHGNPFRLTGREDPDQLLHRLAQGMRFAILLDLPSPPLATNARFLEERESSPPRITLFHLDATDALESEPLMTRARNGELHTVPWREISRLPGVKAETQHPVRIRLRP